MHEDIYALPPPPAHLPFRVEICGVSYCDGSYRICRNRTSGTFVFEYVRKGRGFLRIGQEEFTPEGGDLYLVPAHSDHAYGSSADNPWEKLWFNVSGPLVQNLLTAYDLNGVYLVRHYPGEALFQEGLEIGRRREVSGHADIALVIHRILAAAAACRAELPAGGRKSDSGNAMKRYLDEHLAEPVKLDDLCRLIKKSPAQVLRIFRRDWNATPYDYLLEQRLQMARQYLENTAKTHKEIADELGFGDEYYFSSLFRRKIGISPRFYRQRFRGEALHPALLQRGGTQ